MDIYSTVALVAERGGSVLALGGLDSGKSTFCSMCAEVGVRMGRTVAYVDTDIDQTTVGPPAAIGLRLISAQEDLAPDALARADALAFVGSVSPADHEVAMIIGAMRMVERARQAGATLIVVDTTAFIEGTAGLSMKLAKAEALRPDFIVGFQRGTELDPILGAIRRTTPVEVVALPVDPAIPPSTIDQRLERRKQRLRAQFQPPVFSWTVKPSVLVPAVPPHVDLHEFDRLLVGMEDGKGSCIGLGILEDREDGLHMVSSLDEGARALRLGSIRVGADFGTSAVHLRDIFFD